MIQKKKCQNYISTDPINIDENSDLYNSDLYSDTSCDSNYINSDSDTESLGVDTSLSPFNSSITIIIIRGCSNGF